MMIMNKTPLGTICSNRWMYGIAMGVYGKKNGISLEYRPREDGLYLMINDEWIKENNIKIQIVNKEEEMI